MKNGADNFTAERVAELRKNIDFSDIPEIKDFLYRLQMKNYQKRKVGIIENGTWSPSAGRVIRELLEELKEIEILCKDE